MILKLLLDSTIFNIFWGAEKFIEKNPIVSTLSYVGLVWLFYLLSHLFSILSNRSNPSLKISKIDFVKENPEKKWLIDLKEKNSDLAEHFWYWQQDFKLFKRNKLNLEIKYAIQNNKEAEEISKVISSYNNYMNAEVDQKIINEYNSLLQSLLDKWELENGKKTTAGFSNFTELFMYYEKEKIKPKEEQWLDKVFQKNSKIKSIMKKYIYDIKRLDKEADNIIIPYLHERGIKIPVFNGKPEQPKYFSELISILSKYKRV